METQRPRPTQSGSHLAGNLVERANLVTREAAYVLGNSEAAVRALVARGDLINTSVDRWIRIDVGSIVAFVLADVTRGRLGPLALFRLRQTLAQPETAPTSAGDVPMPSHARPVPGDL